MSNDMLSLIDFHEVHEKIAEDEVILDVRRPDEYQEAHIPQALNIPLDELATRVEELKKYKRIYIHCKRGGRAKTAYDSLSKMGFNNLTCIHDAGMDLWLEKGFPVIKG